MKAVLMSIKPKWCALIASGQKTVEVRKTKPRLETPFKVYIYCTIDGGVKGDMTVPGRLTCGKVIGEFVCDVIFTVSCYYSNPTARGVHSEQPYTCLTDKQMIDYLGNGVEGHGWHISDLVIYDKPRELREFVKYRSDWYCRAGIGALTGLDCNEYITRPFQSWGYVYEADT